MNDVLSYSSRQGSSALGDVYHCTLQIAQAVQMFVLGPRLILSVRLPRIPSSFALCKLRNPDSRLSKEGSSDTVLRLAPNQKRVHRLLLHYPTPFPFC
jgi:hypothetical protein